MRGRRARSCSRTRCCAAERGGDGGEQEAAAGPGRGALRTTNLAPLSAAVDLSFYEFVIACVGLSHALVPGDLPSLQKARRPLPSPFLPSRPRPLAPRPLDRLRHDNAWERASQCHEAATTGLFCAPWDHAHDGHDAQTLRAPHVLQFRAFIDGPRGLMADALRATHTALPAELAGNYAYVVSQKAPGSTRGSAASRRSRRSAISERSSLASDTSIAVGHPGEEAVEAPVSGASLAAVIEAGGTAHV